ncbi:MAG: NTE family [Desulfovibrionaceae bacterium]|nr:MAG: NTE family [Desulfovibrionaceae bacterium]
MSQFRNLVFKGGGVKGIAYIGAISALEDLGVLHDIRRVCGTSSGAIMAAHLALGGKAAQLGEMMTSRFLGGLLDGSVWPVRDFTRLIKEFGWFHGRRLAMWLRRHVHDLAGDADLTFATLAALAATSPKRFKDLTVVATNVTHQCPYIFNVQNTPDVRIWEALRASMSIPFLFSAARLKTGELCVDGGLTWNYPLNYYDDRIWLSRLDDESLFSLLQHPSERNAQRFYNKETLGLMVETRSVVRPQGGPSVEADREKESFPSYLRSMIGLMTDVTASNFLNLPDWQRTIFIEANGVRATDFNISDSGIRTLFETGTISAHAYMEWFLAPENQPLNRVGSGPVPH